MRHVPPASKGRGAVTTMQVVAAVVALYVMLAIALIFLQAFDHRRKREMTMITPPKDWCLEPLEFIDDYNRNSCTFRCDQSVGHYGPHQHTGHIESQWFVLLWGERKDVTT